MADENTEKPKQHDISGDGTIPMGQNGDFMQFLSGDTIQRGIASLTSDIKDNFEEFIGDIKGLITNVEEIIPEDELTDEQKQSGAKTRSRQVVGVEIVKVSKDVLRQLNFGKLKGEDKGEKKVAENKKTSTFEKILKLALPIIGLGAAFLKSIEGMLGGGAFQGVNNLMSKIFLVIGDTLAKKIPGMKFIGNFVKNIFTKIFGKGGAIVGKIMGKGGFAGAKGGLTLMKGLGKGFLKRLPIIGSLISLGSAWKRMQDGDVLGGLIDVGAAIAYMFPFVGTGIGIALDVLNAGMDISEAKAGQGGFIGSIGSGVANVKDWLSKNMRNLPILGTFTRLGEALGYFVEGDIKTGFKTLMSAGWASAGLGGVFDWLFGSDEPGAETTGVVTSERLSNFVDVAKSIGKIVYGKLTDMLDGVLDAVIGKLYGMSFVPKWALNKGLKAIGLDKYVERYAAQAERDDLSNDIKKLNQINAKLKGASKEKGLFGNSEYSKLMEDKKDLQSDIKSSYDIEMVRKAKRDEYNNVDARRDKRDEDMLQEMREANEIARENAQSSNNIGVNNSQSSRTSVFNISPTSATQKKQDSKNMVGLWAPHANAM